MTKNLEQERYESDTNTGEGESSAMKVVKRKYAYMYETPSIVKRQAKDFYECLMDQYIKTGELSLLLFLFSVTIYFYYMLLTLNLIIKIGQAQLKSHVINDTFKLPASVLSLVENDILYHKLDRSINDDILFTRQASVEHTINQNIQDHSVYFIECILKSKASWAFLTQVDLFVQDNKSIDDCARERRHEYYEKPKAFIIDKTYHDKSWKELVVRWGNYEYLALGGYVGLLHGTRRRAFLGSALNNDVVNVIGNDREFEILIPSSPVPYVQSPRYLRSYAKSAASKPWSYSSKRYIQNGFEACHGLALDHHPKRMNKQVKDRGSIVSLLLNVAMEKVYTDHDRQKALVLLEQTKEFKKVSLTRWKKVKTLSQALDIITTAEPSCNFIEPLKLLVEIDNYHEGTEESGPTRITAVVSKQKTKLTEVFNKHLYPLMKKCNEEVLKSLVR